MSISLLRALTAALVVFVSNAAIGQTAPSRARLYSSLNPSRAGQLLTLTAEVDDLGGGAPTQGVVAFSEGTISLGASTLRAVGAGQAALSLGRFHSCALTSVGGVKCWGRNEYGQLGDGGTNRTPTPVDVAGLASGVVAVAAGSSHTCALTQTGGVKCWGHNSLGQLGDGASSDRRVPFDVVGLTSGVVAIDAAGNHSCALTIDGVVKCWGANGSGQLGDGTTRRRLTPVDVSGVGRVVELTAGVNHTCALTAAGVAKCWGDNGAGQLGDGTTVTRLTPVPVVGLTERVISLSGGLVQTCALTGSGGVKCWGNDVSVPADVAPSLSTGVAAISARGHHACALTTLGGVKCWGRNSEGQLGVGSTWRWRGRGWSPYDVVGFQAGAVAVAVGNAHSCALRADGNLACWGENSFGQVGNNGSVVPDGLTEIRAGTYHNCGLTGAGGVKCWGLNASRQLGDGTKKHRLVPVDVIGLGSAITALTTNDSSTCALTSAGGVKCWGANESGELGDGTFAERSRPVSVVGLSSGVARIGTGSFGGHFCAITSGGGVKCWGLNDYGQLGDGTTRSRSTPVDVLTLSSGAVDVVTGARHSCALLTGGDVKCWGANYSGQLGDGTTAPRRNSPVSVVHLENVATIAAGGWHNCAITNTKGLKCWGDNNSGQLGNGTLVRAYEPTDVVGFTSNVSYVTLGARHSALITESNASAYLWGDNYYGIVGDYPENQRTPVPHTIPTGDVRSFALGYLHSCALNNIGGTVCWGANWWGETGQLPSAQSRPRQVKFFEGLVRARARIGVSFGNGGHTLSATYPGDSLHTGSSTTMIQTVQ